MSLLSRFAPPGSTPTSRAVLICPPTDVVPSPRPVLGPPASRVGGSQQQRTAVAQRLGRTLLTTCPAESELARLEADVEELVDVWTPSCHMRSRFELTSALADGDDAIGDVRVDIGETVVAGQTVFLDWVATGHFTGPVFLDDDELIEPTGAVVRVCGALRATFDDGERASRVCCYYDRLSLIEQLLNTPDPRPRGIGC